MNDDELKRFLKLNGKVAQKPTTEWIDILGKIEGDHSRLSFFDKIKSFNFRIGLAGVAVVLIVGISTIKENKNLEKLNRVEEFLTEDTYFSEVEETYSWIR